MPFPDNKEDLQVFVDDLTEQMVSFGPFPFCLRSTYDPSLSPPSRRSRNLPHWMTGTSIRTYEYQHHDANGSDGSSSG